MIRSGIICSAHDSSEGGLATCLAESCITSSGRMIGATIDLEGVKKGDMRLDDILFGEAPSRIVVSLKSNNLQKLEEMAKKHSIPYSKLGKVCGDKLIVRCNNREIINLPVTTLSNTWRNAIPARVDTRVNTD